MESHGISDLRPQHRLVTSEDDGISSSSESDLSTPLLYGTEPGDSSTELEEAESDNDDAENEGGPLNTVTEEVRESRPVLCRSSHQRRPPSLCHLCDCEIREECEREMDISWKNVLICAWQAKAKMAAPKSCFKNSGSQILTRLMRLDKNVCKALNL